ncbi:MAG: hypothetical protein ACYSVY_19730, partial [Planctomycetota bacterium]
QSVVNDGPVAQHTKQDGTRTGANGVDACCASDACCPISGADDGPAPTGGGFFKIIVFAVVMLLAAGVGARGLLQRQSSTEAPEAAEPACCPQPCDSVGAPCAGVD